ncbi:hypothetical protein V5799_016842 [Amblyomma americanum]|uniref:Uncharacterized protein n=1 Tax=Amblyomma americanum TaxID=6943 RepID=A0AAQ4F566_AMBAM
MKEEEKPEVTVDFYKKLVTVGDGGCGKTSLLSTYITGVFPENLRATVFNTVITEVNVGKKKDLREDPETIEVLRERRQSPVSYQEGLAVAKKIKAKGYLECSAKDGTGVSEVILKACRLAIGRRRFNFFAKLCCAYN